ncbi:hypothetical protein LI90_3087 [Carbonactinospora thermoautotrophica]|uniref:Uncharacterized protein n=1 Tax=Carbonactinospora thermoautotrophica TaxID=1469144 RepID=A0A132MW10_9ACTN|nr:hypothetical protein LI90_3087 [Carbonactinospora thermoautotrophica]
MARPSRTSPRKARRNWRCSPVRHPALSGNRSSAGHIRL